MPSSVLQTIHGNTANNPWNQISATLDYTNPAYRQAYFVDGTPATNDLYYKGNWHTWIVGSLGAGANYGGAVNNNNSENNSAIGAGGAIYALDVTDPANFSEGNAKNIVIGDWTAKSLQFCEDNMRAYSSCGDHWGNVYGKPVIRRLHDGNWAIIFGNGLNSQSGAAGIYIIRVDSKTGDLKLRFLDTGTGTKTEKNGINQVTAVDMDEDYITDYIYAGDIQGNVWRFDLTSDNIDNWRDKPVKVFTTSGGKDQPITTAVAVSSVNVGQSKRAMLTFGTGQKFPISASAEDVTYLMGKPQSIYGIWDWNMAGWNNKESVQYQKLDILPSNAALLNQVFADGKPLADGTATRTGSNNKVCWIDTKPCKENNIHYGWKVNLPKEGLHNHC